jgi:hypothetical protein
VTRLHKRAALKLATGDLIINLNGGNEREAALFRAAIDAAKAGDPRPPPDRGAWLAQG